jgi:hypothetical protein
MSDIVQFTNFQLEEVEEQTMMGPVKHLHLVFTRTLDESIIKTLEQILDDEEEIYNDPVKLCPDILYPKLKQIKDSIESGNYNLLELYEWLSNHYKNKIDQLNRLNDAGKINFKNLESVFSIGTKCIGKFNDEDVGFIVNKTGYQTDMFGNNMFVLNGRLTYSDGDKFKQYSKNFIIKDFYGAITIDQLNVRPIKEEELLRLTERGRKLIKYGLSATYAEYTGIMFRKTQYGTYKFKADGRIMIDPTGFRKKIPNYSYPSNTVDCESVPEDLLFMCSPFVNGFSFSTKEWGEIYVNNISDIVFDEKAFDYLVLEPEIKSMIHALITNINGTFSDIISKKSGGLIFALSGTPGIGKTLTAESISEYLKKPLYSITVGELGVNPKDMEQKLNEILEIAYAWDAIILLDEADIFMEKRAANDLVRNAMVSIFLRLLERYQGIMFLTTNRIDEFDPAFKSRISISIEYKNMTSETRFKIWSNLLGICNIQLSESDIIELSNYELNGRQIKSCIRMAQCLSNDTGEPLTVTTIKKVTPYII